MRTAARPLLLLVVLGAAVSLAASDQELIKDAEATVATFKKTDPKIEKFFSSAAGYAAFPTIAKGGLMYEASVGGQKFGYKAFGAPVK